MSKVNDDRGVLEMAVQDLHDGERALIERLPDVRGAVADAALAALIADDEAFSVGQAKRLDAIAGELGVAAHNGENVWLRAILDDADNDIASIAEGQWRDVALIGALRKAKQAERVSYETAIALAGRLGMSDAAQALTASRDEEQASDDALAQALGRLTKRA